MKQQQMKNRKMSVNEMLRKRNDLDSPKRRFSEHSKQNFQIDEESLSEDTLIVSNNGASPRTYGVWQQKNAGSNFEDEMNDTESSII